MHSFTHLRTPPLLRTVTNQLGRLSCWHENTVLLEDEQDLESIVYRGTGHNLASGNVKNLPISLLACRFPALATVLRAPITANLVHSRRSTKVDKFRRFITNPL